MPDDRRKKKRHPVSSRVVFRTERSEEATGTMIDVAPGGVRFQSEVVPTPGVDMWILFEVAGKSFIAPGVLVRTAPGQVAVAFRQEPFGLQRMLENLPQA